MQGLLESYCDKHLPLSMGTQLNGIECFVHVCHLGWHSQTLSADGNTHGAHSQVTHNEVSAKPEPHKP
jgi:hypothetical protein